MSSPASRVSEGVISTAIIGAMQAVLPSSDRDVIMDTFGISSNTWNKLRKGAAIRPSTATRLVDRLVRLGIVEDGHA